jgi:hypothetical protein
MDDLDSSPGRLPARPDQRQAAIEALVRHYAADHISIDEFERRVDVAHRTHDPQELARLTADLPAIGSQHEAQLPEADRLILRGARAVAGAVRDSQTLVAIMGGVERRGVWTPARRTVVLCVMGGADLDFREARFGPGVTEVFVFAMMGGADIVVPPDLAVDASGLAVMGGFGHQEQRYVLSDPDAPVLKLRGFALMGGVDISVRYPGETAKDARRRRKAERTRLQRGDQT